MKRDIYIAIDPGNEQSGWVVSLKDNSKLLYKNKDNNSLFFNKIKQFINEENVIKVGIEYPSSYGMPVNQTLLDTCTIIGIILQICLENKIKVELIFRKSVKMFLCNSVRANDSEVNSRVREYLGEDYTNKKPNYYYWNEEVEKNEGARYANNDMYAALGVLLYMVYPHDILIKNEKEQERNKISKQLQDIINII